MIKFYLLVLFLSFSLCLSPTTYLTPADKEHLKSVLDPAWSLTDLSQVFYATGGYKHLGIEVSDKQKVCTFVKNAVKEKPSVEVLYFASAAANALGCPVTPPSNAKQALTDLLREGSSPQELFYAASALASLGASVDGPKVVRALQHALKKDDSVLSLGYAFHVASTLPSSVDLTAILERVEDALVQADEVDGVMLQFEGGLSITALVLSGCYRISMHAGATPPLSETQAVKFANYLMSRRSVQTAKGAFYLLDAVKLLTDNKVHTPVALTLYSSVAVSASQPIVRVRATDLMGVDTSPLVLLGTIEAEGSGFSGDLQGAVDVPLKRVDQLYELDVFAAAPSIKRGFYRLNLRAQIGKQDKAGIVGVSSATLSFKVLSAVALKEATVGTADADRGVAPSLVKVLYPQQSSTVLEVDAHQRLLLRFVVRDAATNTAQRVHQAFVVLTADGGKGEKATENVRGREMIFVAEPDSTDTYKFDMDISSKRLENSGIRSGTYALEVLVGDPCVSNPLRWRVASVKVTVAGSEEQTDEQKGYKVLPEIRHEFRLPERRPPQVVSTAFTALSIAPLGLLIIGWLKLGVNIWNFPISLSAVGFHGGFASMLGLFVVFWIRLDMFTTLRLLCLFGTVTALCGNSMLARIAAARKEKGN